MKSFHVFFKFKWKIVPLMAVVSACEKDTVFLNLMGVPGISVAKEMVWQATILVRAYVRLQVSQNVFSGDPCQ